MADLKRGKRNNILDVREREAREGGGGRGKDCIAFLTSYPPSI